LRISEGVLSYRTVLIDLHITYLLFNLVHVVLLVVIPTVALKAVMSYRTVQAEDLAMDLLLRTLTSLMWRWLNGRGDLLLRYADFLNLILKSNEKLRTIIKSPCIVIQYKNLIYIKGQIQFLGGWCRTSFIRGRISFFHQGQKHIIGIS
jgi:hypothetical protein